MDKNTDQITRNLPQTIALVDGRMDSGAAFTAKLGTTVAVGGTETPESIGFFVTLKGKALLLFAWLGWAVVRLWELSWLAKSITSFALSAGKSFKTITCPP